MKAFKQGAFITIKAHSINFRRMVTYSKQLFPPVEHVLKGSKLVLDYLINSNSTNRKANRNCGFLKTSLPKKSCNIGRFGSGILSNSVNNATVRVNHRKFSIRQHREPKGGGVAKRVSLIVLTTPFSCTPTSYSINICCSTDRSTIFRVK